MAWWNFKRPDKHETRSDSWAGSIPSALFETVTPDSAMRQATVFACVSLISQTIASLPATLYEIKESGNVPSRQHPTFQLLKSAPNAFMGPSDLWSAVVSSLLLRGSAYVQIFRDPFSAAVTALVPLPTDRVSKELNAAGTNYVYRVKGTGKGKDVRLDASDIWEIRGLTLDGVTGISPIGYCRESIGLAVAAEKQAAHAFANAISPSGTLSFPEANLTPEQRKEALENVKETLSGGKAGGVLLLEGGVTFTPLTVDSEDLAYLEQRRYSREDIAALFRVPAHLVGSREKSSYASVSAEADNFVRFTLRYWLTAIEDSFARCVLLPSERERYEMRFNLEGLLRGDIQTRFATYTQGIQNGVYSPNDARRIEGLPPRTDAGGDAYMSPLNMRQQGGAVPAPEPQTTLN